LIWAGTPHIIRRSGGASTQGTEGSIQKRELSLRKEEISIWNNKITDVRNPGGLSGLIEAKKGGNVSDDG
jgi:hypothetical protein